MTDTLPVFSTMEPSSSDKVLEHMGTVCLAVAKFLNQRATLWGMLWSLKSFSNGHESAIPACFMHDLYPRSVAVRALELYV